MAQPDKSPQIPEGVRDYFVALRAEIIEAQKLRVQVGLAKAVVLGTLLGFFFNRDAVQGDTAILICPFVAFMFDCMVFGLSYNIHDLGGYIREQIETRMGFDTAWQIYRHGRKKTDWGRIVFRLGSYGLSVVVTWVSVGKLWLLDPQVAKISHGGLIGIIVALVLLWGLLIAREAYDLWQKPETADSPRN